MFFAHFTDFEPCCVYYSAGRIYLKIEFVILNGNVAVFSVSLPTLLDLSFASMLIGHQWNDASVWKVLHNVSVSWARLYAIGLHMRTWKSLDCFIIYNVVVPSILVFYLWDSQVRNGNWIQTRNGQTGGSLKLESERLYFPYYISWNSFESLTNLKGTD